MPKQSAPQELAKIAPKLVDVTNNVLFADIWERPGLSPRDRRLVTVSVLAALYRSEQGWPNAMTATTRKAWESMNGQQACDPAKLAAALLQLASQAQPPLRFIGGADAIEAVAAKARDLLAQSEASRPLSGDLAHADAA